MLPFENIILMPIQNIIVDLKPFESTIVILPFESIIMLPIKNIIFMLPFENTILLPFKKLNCLF